MPRPSTMVLIALIIFLLCGNFALMKTIRLLKSELEKCDEVLERYGDLDMALANLTRRQIIVLAASSAIGLSGLNGCQDEARDREVTREIPVVMDRMRDDSDVSESPSYHSATIASMLFEMHGVDISEDELELPMCIANTADAFVDGLVTKLPTDKTVINATGTLLQYVPAPAVVWAHGTQYILTYADEASVYALTYDANDLDDITIFPWSEFQQSYDIMGRQCVYITNRGYSPQT